MSSTGSEGKRSLTRSQSFAPRTITKRLPVAVQRALPVVARSAAGLAIGVVTDYAARSLTRRAASAVTAPLRRAVTPSTPATGGKRHIVTEMVVVERENRR
ncbi:MAG TPA: hypothetical protein QGI71_01320 [Dehalococcoidia bacterium]|nr:hypothetical protein [Dehalococcoidia bacterium]